MSLFAGKRNKGRNFRRRRDDDEDNEAEETTKIVTSRSKNNKNLPSNNKSAKSSTAGLLSFDDEEESGAEVFKVKKLNRQKKPPPAPAKPSVSQPVRTTTNYKSDNVHLRNEEDTGLKSRDSSDEEVTMGGDDAEESDEEDARAELARQIRMGAIPDAITIHAARKQREMARQLGGDYLPLDDTKCYSANNSRLVRDDENDKSGSDEDREKDIGFSKVKGITKQQQVLEALETVAESEESDEEMRKWEEEQINKGVKIIQATQQPVNNSLPTGDQSFGVGTGAYPYVEAQTQFSYQQYGEWQQQHQQQLPSNTAASKLLEKLSPLTIASVKGRLQSRLDELKEMSSGHRQSLARVKEMKVAAVDDIDTVQARSGEVTREYQFFQEMKLYLEDLLSCLAEKVPMIDDLHKKVLEARELRAERFAIRRQQDVQDELDECKAHPSKSIVPDESKKAQLRRHRQVERQARRRRRKDARQKEGISPYQYHEGLSTDDEEKESDKQTFVQQMAQLSVEADKLFDDVVDEFASISMIKARLETWKFQFPQSYQQAYISLCLPKLFLPFVKLQMLTWNPLEAKNKDFEEMGWFEILMFYGFREGNDVAMSDDDDTHLIPSLVERAVLPLVTSLVENVWEVMSSQQTKRLSQLVSRLMEDYPTVSTDSKNTETMLNAILTRLRKAVDDVYVPLFSKMQLENSVKHSEFFNRQFWSCVKLLGNITVWKDTLSTQSLKQLAIEGLLNRHLLLSLKNSPAEISLVDKADKIITLLPADWYQCDSKLFTGLSQYLVSLSELLGYSPVNHDKASTRDAIAQIAELLEIIGASEHSELVIREHTLKVNR